MKTLYDCKKACKVKVKKLYAEPELKQRFISFGIMKDAEIEILQQTATKSTVEIKVGTMQIALRSEEAKLIEVEKL
jgi:ferrous iron transport protein A